jgi:hypothetical protein
MKGGLMGIFERYLDSAQHKWNGYMCTLLGSMVPMVLRFIISLDCEINMFDIKDMLFAGLTMNLSNLNLMNNDRLKQKERIAVLSGLFIFFISIGTGISFYEENPEVKSSFSVLKTMSGTVAVASVWTKL